MQEQAAAALANLAGDGGRRSLQQRGGSGRVTAAPAPADGSADDAVLGLLPTFTLALAQLLRFSLRSGCQRNYDTGGVAVNDVVLHPNQAELISGDQNGGIRTWDLR